MVGFFRLKIWSYVFADFCARSIEPVLVCRTGPTSRSRSAPEQNVLPRPRNTTASTLSSASARSTALPRSSSSCGLTQLRLYGRFSQMVAMPLAATSYWITCSSAMVCLVCSQFASDGARRARFEPAGRREGSDPGSDFLRITRRGVAIALSAGHALQDRRYAEQIVGAIKTEIRFDPAARALAVPRHVLIQGRNPQRLQVLPLQRAALV